MSTSKKTRRIATALTTTLVWLLVIVLGLLAIYAAYHLALAVFALVTRLDLRTVNQFYTGVLFGQITVLVIGAVWLVVVIWSGEYALKHIGERRVWKMFSWILGAELFLILIAWFFNLI